MFLCYGPMVNRVSDAGLLDIEVEHIMRDHHNDIKSELSSAGFKLCTIILIRCLFMGARRNQLWEQRIFPCNCRLNIMCSNLACVTVPIRGRRTWTIKFITGERNQVILKYPRWARWARPWLDVGACNAVSWFCHYIWTCFMKHHCRSFWLIQSSLEHGYFTSFQCVVTAISLVPQQVSPLGWHRVNASSFFDSLRFTFHIVNLYHKGQSTMLQLMGANHEMLIWGSYFGNRWSFVT